MTFVLWAIWAYERRDKLLGHALLGVGLWEVISLQTLC